ncbi:MAG: sensor histidine kinase [Draconibacterium sp.]
MRRLIFLLLCMVSFSICYAQNNLLNKDELKDVIEKYFITKDVPTRYYSNILIRLDGNPSSEDSLIVQGLVDTLNPLIATWDVYIIKEKTANLILEINEPNGELFGKTRLGNRKEQEIVQSKIVVSIPPDASFQERSKILYFYLLKALILYNPNKELEAKFPGSVFSVKKPSDVTFNPVDFQLVAGLYSSKYDDDLKAPVNPIKRSTRYRQVLIISTVLANIVATLLLLWMFLIGVFKTHNYIFKEYLKQGIVVIVAITVGMAISTFTPIIYMLSDSSMRLTQVFASLIGFIPGSLVLGIFTLLILFFSEKYILRGNRTLFIHVVLPLLTTTIVPAFLSYVLVELVTAKSSMNTITIDKQNLILTVLSITMSIAFYRAFLIFLSRKSESIINQKDVELARMSEMHRKAELQSLRAKINPHFLYNSLNSIASLASIDPKKTEQMALSLSDFFKYSINREQRQTNPLSDELKAVETYLEIEKVRFGERLTYSVECPETLKSVQIPQLLIQPLVENAVKHGVSKLLENGEVRIVVSELDFAKISIRVYDNGPGFPDGPLSGFGIRNTHERLQLIYAGKASINWQNNPEKYIEIVLPQHPA